MSIESTEVNDKKAFMLVFRNEIGKNLFSGTFSKNVKHKILDEKPSKV